MTPQPQMVGFWDLVGVGIAPVSKITAVKYLPSNCEYTSGNIVHITKETLPGRVVTQ